MPPPMAARGPGTAPAPTRLRRSSKSHHDLWRIPRRGTGDIPSYNTNKRAAPMTPPTDLRRGRSPYLVPLLLCLLVPGVLALGACGKGGGPGAEGAQAEARAPEAVPVEVAAVARRPISASFTGTAALEARGESQVVAKTSGVALEVYAEEGQYVHAGQVLVKLDSARAQLQAAQTAAQVRKLEANFARAQTLHEQNLISANDFDQLKFDLANARAANRLSNLEVSYASVRAPISGVVAQRSI